MIHLNYTALLWKLPILATGSKRLVLVLNSRKPNTPKKIL